MIKDKEQFHKLDSKDGGNVTFGDNAKGKMVGIGEIGNPLSHLVSRSPRWTFETNQPRPMTVWVQKNI